ncbi:acyl carrier protein, partial [candidate division KSB1 bacterium]
MIRQFLSKFTVIALAFFIGCKKTQESDKPAPQNKFAQETQLTDAAIDTVLENRIKQIIVERFGIDANTIAPESNFVEDLGLDSLDLVELVLVAEEEFGIEIPDEDALKITTFQEAYFYLKTGRVKPPDSTHVKGKIDTSASGNIGVVKWFNSSKGYGFITGANGEDV